jgi:hypothetical protein
MYLKSMKYFDMLEVYVANTIYFSLNLMHQLEAVGGMREEETYGHKENEER